MLHVQTKYYLDLDLLSLRLLYLLRVTDGGDFIADVNLGDSSFSLSLFLFLSGDLDLDLDRDLDCDLDLSNLLSFIFLAFCFALKNSNSPNFSHPSLKCIKTFTESVILTGYKTGF